ncbi:MAG TPA: ABC transporter permease, partial [Gemmatimonadaceae bacterium]|nr:ABC transporter permease [Gemmatimonadaceae bacterium]
MLFGETIAVALSALRANKLRSILTMLGIVIGVAAVIAMIALGTGAQAAVKDRIAALGTTLLTINPGQQRGFGVAIADAQAKLTMDDSKALDERATSLLAVQPEMNRSLQVQWGNKNANTQVVGTTSNYLEVRKYT